MDFKINDIGEQAVTIKTPAKHKIEFQPISDAERLVDNAEMAITGIAGKLKITLSYNKIRQSDLNVILGQTWSIFKTDKTLVRELTFPSPEGEKVITCYFSPISIELIPDGHHSGSDPYWSNLQLVLIEI